MCTIRNEVHDMEPDEESSGMDKSWLLRLSDTRALWLKSRVPPRAKRWEIPKQRTSETSRSTGREESYN